MSCSLYGMRFVSKSGNNIRIVSAYDGVDDSMHTRICLANLLKIACLHGQTNGFTYNH